MIQASPLADIKFTVRFTLTTLAEAPDMIQSVAGVEGLTVLFTFYDPEGDVISGQSDVPATEERDGVYSCVLPLAKITDEGLYSAVAATTSEDVDCQELTEFALVAAAYEPTDPSWALDNTLVGLLTALRMRLNDADAGNYDSDELGFCLNLAYRETVVESRCNTDRVETALEHDVHTYSGGKVFDPIEVMVDDVPLKRTNLQDIGVSILGWDGTPADRPTQWLPVSGSWLRLHPSPHVYSSAGGIFEVVGAPAVADVFTAVVGLAGVEVEAGAVDDTILNWFGLTGLESPSEAAAAMVDVLNAWGYVTASAVGAVVTWAVEGIVSDAVDFVFGGAAIDYSGPEGAVTTLVLYGYAYPEPLVEEGDTPYALPDGYAVQVMLDRAEAEARKLRPQMAANVRLYEVLMARWQAACVAIAAGMRGK